MLGIVQEQHPDRARLFMQWKQMDWPVMVDSFDLLEVSAVPITFLIDEHGVIRAKNPRIQDIRSILLERTYEPVQHPATRIMHAPRLFSRKISPIHLRCATWHQFNVINAVAVEMLCAREGLEKTVEWVIRFFEAANPCLRYEAWSLFRAGVAYRMRYDSPKREADDFAHAVECWSAALEIDPNNYLWRRRIQQYGPRLDKPYPFYDWVPEARREIEARGQTPHLLTVEPTGAEIASPIKTFDAAGGEDRAPDPDGRITRDDGGFVSTEVVVVPPKIKPGESARVHITFSVNDELFAHWNNEGGGLELWIDPPEDCQLNRRVVRISRAEFATSDEDRVAEFEIRAPADVSGGSLTLKGLALYYVCQGIYGKCLYRRQDIEISIPVICKTQPTNNQDRTE